VSCTRSFKCTSGSEGGAPSVPCSDGAGASAPAVAAGAAAPAGAADAGGGAAGVAQDTTKPAKRPRAVKTAVDVELRTGIENGNEDMATAPSLLASARASNRIRAGTLACRSRLLRATLAGMRTALVALHGFTLNGPVLRRLLGDLEARLSEHVDLSFPDAPHTASEASVTALLRRMGGTRSTPPHLEWWNASADGRAYQGWEASLELLRAEVRRQPALALFGFSQGAAVAAALAALAAHGAFPKLRCVVLVAGFAPRATELLPYFDAPISVPSLHVWGESDGFAKHAATLESKFSSLTRRVVTWPGAHRVPTRGAAADAIVEFVRSHSRDEP